MAQKSPSEGRAQFKTFGWQGITLTIPTDWDLVFTQGRHRSGHFRLADSDAVRLEVRWQKDDGSRPLDSVVDTYVRRTAKKARKERAGFTVQRDLGLAAPPGRESECYRWEADRSVLAMLSRCTECDRLVHLHMPGGGRNLARTVFGSLGDHPEDDGPTAGHVLWRFLDVEFRTPLGMPLVESDLRAGCVRMGFRRGMDRLTLARVSLAQVLLGQKGLEEWFRGFWRKSLKRRTLSCEEAVVKGHAGLRLDGRPWRVMNPLAAIGRRRVLRGACWHCDRTNRLMVCCLDGAEGALPALESALESFHCCPSK